MLPAYDGNSPWPDYERIVDTLAEFYGWTDEERRIGVALNLKGRALKVYNTLPGWPDPPYDTLCTAMRRWFTPSQESYLQQFYGRRQNLRETLEDFALDLEHLAQRAFGSVPEALLNLTLVRQFVEGVRESALQRTLAAQGPRDLAEALGIANRVYTQCIHKTSKPIFQVEQSRPPVLIPARKRRPRKGKREAAQPHRGNSAGNPPQVDVKPIIVDASVPVVGTPLAPVSDSIQEKESVLAALFREAHEVNNKAAGETEASSQTVEYQAPASVATTSDIPKGEPYLTSPVCLPQSCDASVRITCAAVEPQGSVIIEPAAQSELPPGVMVGRTLVDTTKGDMTLRLLNLTAQEQVLPAFAALGRLEPASVLHDDPRPANMTTIKSNHIFFWTTVCTLIICMILIAMYSGFEHETKKFKTLLVTVVLVLLFQYLIGDPIKFALLAIDSACWPPQQRKFATDREATHHSRMDYLKLRLSSLRSQLLLTEEHRNEKLNEKYKHIAQDLWLYGKYFFFLMCVVLVTRDATMYHNTHNIERLFYANHTDYYGLQEVYHINQLFDFIESSLINAFNPNTSETGISGWVHGEQTKMLGVVRLRQLRLTMENYGLDEPEFSERDYMPEWQLPHRRLHYTDKYWRIYEPWLPISSSYDFIDNLLLNFNHKGHFQSYPELKGYVALLARSRQNSMKVLEYLTEYKWLTYNTSAVFMDFTLYNVDVNIFSVCTLRVEQTPFGGIIPHVDVDSVKLLENLDQLTHYGLLTLLCYVIVVIQFSKALVLKLWYEPAELRSMWNKLDLVIFILNIAVVTLIIIREWLVSSMLKKVEGASKMEFIDFRRPTRLHMFITWVVGFLICITTLRLWKVLQFASVFQLFTHTLYLAWKAVASTAVVIGIFLMAFGIAVVTINGNNSSNFNRLVKSIVTCMCFSFGFSSQVTPEDLFHGGEFLGILLYAILAFVIAVLLINVFVSLINDYFTTAKAQRDARSVRRINFIQFLRVEYANFFRFFHKLRFFRKSYHRNNRTVSENIKHDLDERESHKQKQRKLEAFASKKHVTKVDESLAQEEYRHRLERLYTIAAIMQTQIEILERILFTDKEGNLTRDDEGKAGERQRDYRMS
ncbi:uncharacterized protein LOC115630076 [Scaptodrosophila lebanonensis]|uniref:Uncharacterized protein LOC115630076 n=1 Tax=Drosophila lebanonensis TaxID=7225 RepID=A0A6J2U2E2_DROLE|nr:uncharacterized protein LOC115630076 [Scaptodrosophila lebanonensis]